MIDLIKNSYKLIESSGLIEELFEYRDGLVTVSVKYSRGDFFPRRVINTNDAVNCLNEMLQSPKLYNIDKVEIIS